eukprot:CAMPEP_0194076308 /NCGR_PEP_ID=MMETSP0149-20130528/3126_1 /TAXON_ID=122233 /ORGANISM="Chaetoceros debilis, Strain MM31A-1" /LENGTH=725 /DNA_ID=CAMNT_0038757017 /DNA_START=109 /DNA_END=2286 /DNA_ORIENTATION=+
MISAQSKSVTIFLVGALASHLLSCFSLVEAWSALGVRKTAFRHLGKHRQEGNSVSSLDYRREPSTDDKQITAQSDEEMESSIRTALPGTALKDTSKKQERTVRKTNIQVRKNRMGTMEKLLSSNKKPLIKQPLNSKNAVPETVVTTPQELRSAVFDQGVLLKDIEFRNVTFMPSFEHLAEEENNSTVTAIQSSAIDDNEEIAEALNHEVIKLLEQRFKSKSKPGARGPDDDAHLALSIEGGGMRGAVSAGMASAIAVLGLSDAFDSIYGSSAGSVIGAYMISRQMCVDVYTDVLTTAKTKFVSKGRLASSLATNILDQRVLNSTTEPFSRYISPAMNISFVLDSIMDPSQGLRPLDIDTFRKNDEVQKLRVVTSTVRDGKMETHCLGSSNMDFFDEVDENGEVLEYATTNVGNKRHGLFSCLETSMLVPAATGPPQPLLRHDDAHLNMTTTCFDAFCYEPIPYRSAVKEGASHVLVLKSRPTGSPIGSKPGSFEKLFAPMYFERNHMPQVSSYFQNGGQQYIYIEDYLTLEEGRKAGSHGVLVPPQKILYGVDRDEEAEELVTNRDKWSRAHLFPLAVPEGQPELSVLSVDADEVVEAVRLGFAVAFDLLAPITGVGFNTHLDGERVADLLFSHAGISPDALKAPINIAGMPISDDGSEENQPLHERSESLRNDDTLDGGIDDGSPCPEQDAYELLQSLPGFHNGRMQSLSHGLHQLRQGSRGRH